jgi:hypothetical protein
VYLAWRWYYVTGNLEAGAGDSSQDIKNNSPAILAAYPAHRIVEMLRLAKSGVSSS